MPVRAGLAVFALAGPERDCSSTALLTAAEPPQPNHLPQRDAAAAPIGGFTNRQTLVVGHCPKRFSCSSLRIADCSVAFPERGRHLDRQALERGQNSGVVTDEQIALMSPEQRRDLIRRLSLASRTVPTSHHRYVGRREVEIIVMVVSAVVLVPWIAYLAVTLPRVYVTHDWEQAWVGFDILLLLLIVANAVLSLLRRQMVMLTAFATGVVLICDAWFDWMTSNRADVGWATATALFVELPLAVLLITESCRLLRVVPARWGVLGDRVHTWDVPIPLSTGSDHSIWRRRRQ